MLTRSEKRYIYAKLDQFLLRVGAYKDPLPSGKVMSGRIYSKIVHDLKDFVLMKSDRVGDIVHGIAYINKLGNSLGEVDLTRTDIPAAGHWDAAMKEMEGINPVSFYSRHGNTRDTRTLWRSNRRMIF